MMVFKDVLNELQDVHPKGTIRSKFLWDAANHIPDTLWSGGDIVELGVYLGGLTLRLARVAELTDCMVHAIDAWVGLTTGQSWSGSDLRDKFVDNTQGALQKELIEIHDGLSVNVGENWTYPICFLVVDAGHRYEDVVADIDVWTPHVKPGGMIFFDDYGPWDGTRGAKGAIEDTLFQRPDEFEIVAGGQSTWILIQKRDIEKND